uniref:Uncharacterized protein n=1 Tax=Anguilla anguilla TaxID=7936 RepID=A0A0E9XJM5_ANGAN
MKSEIESGISPLKILHILFLNGQALCLAPGLHHRPGGSQSYPFWFWLRLRIPAIRCRENWLH